MTIAAVTSFLSSLVKLAFVGKFLRWVGAVLVGQPKADVEKTRVGAVAELKPFLDFDGDVEIDVNGLHVRKAIVDGRPRLRIWSDDPTTAPDALPRPSVIGALPPPERPP